MAKPQLIAETFLLSYLDQQRYILKPNLPHWLLIQVPGWKDAQFLAENFKHVLTRWVRYRAPVYFQYGNQSPFLMQLSEQGDLMDIQIDGLKVNRALLDVFGIMLSNPDRSLSLVHIPSQRQISVSGGAGGRFLLGVDKAETTRWTRNQYWLSGDLTRFNHDWQQELSPDSDRWFEYRYQIDSQAPIEHRPVNKADFLFISRYKLIQGPSGELFHLGENLGIETVA